MKNILRILALCLLLAVPACALAAGEVSCYWQLEAIEVENTLSDAYGPALAQTDVKPVTENDPAKMTEIVRGDGLKYVLAYNDFHNLESIGVNGKSEKLITYTYKNGNG